MGLAPDLRFGLAEEVLGCVGVGQGTCKPVVQGLSALALQEFDLLPADWDAIHEAEVPFSNPKPNDPTLNLTIQP